jgi:hypothetical protein
MKLYQLINSGGYPAAVHENDLAVFESHEDALDCINQMGWSTADSFENVTIKEVRELSEITTTQSFLKK